MDRSRRGLVRGRGRRHFDVVDRVHHPSHASCDAIRKSTRSIAERQAWPGVQSSKSMLVRPWRHGGRSELALSNRKYFCLLVPDEVQPPQTVSWRSSAACYRPQTNKQTAFANDIEYHEWPRTSSTSARSHPPASLTCSFHSVSHRPHGRGTHRSLVWTKTPAGARDSSCSRHSLGCCSRR